MAVKFKSQATGDLVMIQDTARAVLGAIGKDPDQSGILSVEEMPAALQTLKSASDEVDPVLVDEDHPPPTFMEEQVSLRKHAAPFVRMIEQAMAEGKPIVWGV